MKILEYIPLLKACVVAGLVSGLPALLRLIPIFDCQDGIIPTCYQERVKAWQVMYMHTSRGLEVVDLGLCTAYSDG